MSKFKRNLVTTALPYANGPVHIGHLAGVYVPADIYVRYLRKKGEDVAFIGGSDEHGVPITIKAQKEGVTPQDIVDRYHKIIKDSFEELGISFDIYSRTSSKTHHELSSAFFKKLYDAGKFIEKTSMQFYDEKAGQFLADRYIIGTCPHCGNDSEEYINEAMSPARYLKDEWGKDSLDYYGFQIWIMNYHGQRNPYFRGMLGQYIIAIPERNAIIVRLGHKKDEKRIRETTRDVYRYMDIGMKILDNRQ